MLFSSRLPHGTTSGGVRRRRGTAIDWSPSEFYFLWLLLLLLLLLSLESERFERRVGEKRPNGFRNRPEWAGMSRNRFSIATDTLTHSHTLTHTRVHIFGVWKPPPEGIVKSSGFGSFSFLFFLVSDNGHPPFLLSLSLSLFSFIHSIILSFFLFSSSLSCRIPVFFWHVRLYSVVIGFTGC